RRFSETLLEELGYRVLAAENGEHALELIRQYEGDIDLLLTDVVMPGIQGPQLAAHFSRIRPDVPVLYVSGYTDPKILVDLDLGDRRAFLQKPFTRDGLQNKIQELLGLQPTGVSS
ncbi:MAG: response regulator, partial [Myxococcota bacterium]